LKRSYFSIWVEGRCGDYDHDCPCCLLLISKFHSSKHKSCITETGLSVGSTLTI